MRVRLQCLVGMVLLAILASITIFVAPDYIELIGGGAVTGIGMLGMKALEGKSDS